MNEPKASRYHRRRRQSAGAATAVAAAVLGTLLATGWSLRLRDLVGDSAWGYALVLGLLLEAAVLPLTWYRTLHLDCQYGLATARAAPWLLDHLKGVALVMLASVVAAECAYALMRASPQWWWFGAATGGALFDALLTSAAPVAILPLFHRSRPVEREGLRRRLLDLSARAGVPVLMVHEWLVGEETGRATAVLVGSGSTRRILLSSALLANYSDDEIEVVLAHEMAHHVHRDIAKALAGQFFVLLGGCLAAAGLLHVAWRPLALDSPSDVAGIPLILLAVGAVSLLAAPLLHAQSRRTERRADRFALQLVSRPDAFSSVVRRMAEQNLVEERPSRAALWLFHSHPPVEERIRAARAGQRDEARAG